MSELPADDSSGVFADLDAKTRATRLLELDLISRVAEEPEKWSRNDDAYMAIGNIRDGAAEKIIALMRSGEEIHPLVREAIAQAFEDGLGSAKSENVRLVVKGDGQRSHAAKIAKRRQYVRVAQYYEKIMAETKISSNDALEKAARDFGAAFDAETVGSSVTYYRKMLQETGHIQDDEMRAVAEHQFHLADIDPNWRDTLEL